MIDRLVVSGGGVHVYNLRVKIIKSGMKPVDALTHFQTDTANRHEAVSIIFCPCLCQIQDLVLSLTWSTIHAHKKYCPNQFEYANTQHADDAVEVSVTLTLFLSDKGEVKTK